MAVKSTLNPK